MITTDYHTHTLYSHGKGTVEQNVQAAVAAGLDAVAISEHGPGHLFYGVRGGKLASLKRQVQELNTQYGDKIRILTGMECNLTGFGLCDLPEGDAGYDILLLGFHKGIWPRDRHALSWSKEALGLGKADPLTMANALLAAAEKYRIQMIAHPGLYVQVDMPTLAKGAAQLGVWLELNENHHGLSPAEVAEAARLGAKFALSSDAHRPAHVGRVSAAYQLAEQAGILSSVVNLRTRA